MTPSPFEPLLDDQGFVVLDGGLASQLELQGADLADELWSARLLADDPDAIVRAHRAFLEAGADCIITASYQATPRGLRRRGASASEARGLILSSLSLAERARDEFLEAGGATRAGGPLIAASVGPYGAFLADGSEYRGDYGLDEEALVDFHRERFELLAEAAPLLAIETIPSVVEVEAIRRLLAEHPGTPAWVSFCCRDGARLADGTDVLAAAAALEGLRNVVAVGVNCTAPQNVEPLLDRLAGRTGDAQLIVYPNSGEPYDAGTKSWGEAPAGADVRGLAGRWREQGARLVGGCCRVTAPELAGLAARLRGA